MSSPMSPDSILEMLAFWGSLFASIYFFKKKNRVLGWIFAVGVLLIPALIGFVFVFFGD